MNKTALRHAWENFHEAQAAHARLQKAQLIGDVERSWAAFLSALGTAFNKLESGSKGDPKAQPWFGEVRHDRRTDPLLKYVHHARNCREHGISEITKREGGTFELVGDAHIHELELMPDGVRGRITSLDPANPARVRVEPVQVVLVSVVDSGVTYNPPEEHRGAAINGRTPVTVAGLALLYLEERLREAAKYA